MSSLTTHEISVLNGIAYHEMNPGNGAKPSEFSDVMTWNWVEDFADDLTASQVKGVMTSLVKKDLIVIWDAGTEDASVQFTEAGYKSWEANDDDRKG
tara:strand:- start:687 stop:977 length:291 start_codon:yes stop_codon:yes gene_type:complete